MSNTTNAPQEDEIDLGQLLALLLGNKWLIAAFVVVFFVLAYFYLLVTKPVYQANALIQVEEKQSGLAGFGDIESLFAGESDGSTEIEVIKSRFVLGDVVDKQFLQINISPRYFPVIGETLAWRYKAESAGAVNEPLWGFKQYNTGGEYINVAGLHVPESLTSKALLLRVLGPNAYELYDVGGGLLLTGTVGRSATNKNGTVVLLITELRANTGAEFEISINRRIDAINNLRKALSIGERGKKTGVISLSIDGINRIKIKAILNEIVNVYQRQNVKRLSEEAERSINFLSIQVPAIRTELESAEQSLNDYRAESSSIDMQFEAEAALTQIVAVESQLNELELKESEISSRYKKGHPLYSALLNQRSRLELEKQRVNQSVEKLPATQQKILRLMRDVEVSSEVYLQLLNKLEELKVIRAGTVGNVRILDEAEVLTKAVKPKKSLVMLLAMMLGGMLGVAVVFLRHFLNAGIVNPNEVQEQLGLNSYGVIPLSVLQKKVQDNGEEHAGVLAVDSPTDLAIEAIRGARTSLHFAMMEAKNNIVMLTGPSPGIGKSFISINLAALSGASAQRILLVDGDMRRGHMHKAFAKERSPGLSNILSEGLDVDAVKYSSVLENVDLITTGSIPPNPSELVMSGAFTQFLEKVSKQYDIVIIDTPPVLAVTDAAIVGKQAGTTMIVVRHNVNTLREIKQTVTELEQLDVTVKGYIYNFYEQTSGSYDGHYYNYRYDSTADET